MIAASEPLASCAFCGLPIAGLKVQPAQEPETKYFCCFGCRFAADVTQARGEEGAVRWLFARLGLAIFLTMNVMVFSMALWSQDVYDLPQQGAGIGFTMAGLFRYLCLLFALPVLLLLGGPLLDDALEQLTQGRLSADLLLVVGVAAAYLYSVLSVFGGQGPIYFEVGCMVLVLVTTGRWLEAEGKLRTTAAIEGLHRLLPDTARLLQDGQEIIVPLEQIQPGQRLRVLAGERIPCDGVVRGQAVTVDEQIWTGESKPAVKEQGQSVYGGSLNLDGELLLDATAPPRGGALARLIDLVHKARLHQSRFERLAQRVSAWFLPVVLVLAVGAMAWHGSHSGIDQGILAALAVLLIACPCALGLATPMALWAALGQAARSGLLFRNGEALERLAHIRAVCLDKTGTLTTGQSRVVRLALANNVNQTDLLALAARLAGASTHVHARAISQFVAEQNTVADHNLPLQPVEKRGLAPAEPCKTLEISPSAGACPLFSTGLDVRTLPGRGLVAHRPDGGESIYLGSLRFLAEAGLMVPQELSEAMLQDKSAGHPLCYLGWNGAVRAVFVFAEEVRPETKDAIQQLKAAGLEVQALTGDSASAGSALAQELGLPVQAGLLPEDKVNALAQMRRHYGPIAMVGDGINDAPALAASDVGIAMGCGADVARDSAAVCLLGNDLRQLPWAIALARRTLRVIRLNLFWAFVYNVGGIALALTGRLNPILAALAMVLSSFLVVTNSLRLRGPAPEIRPTEIAQE